MNSLPSASARHAGVPRTPVAASLDDLSDLALQVIGSHLELQDLMRLSRVSRRFRSVVAGAEEVWRALYKKLVAEEEEAASLAAQRRALGGQQLGTGAAEAAAAAMPGQQQRRHVEDEAAGVVQAARRAEAYGPPPDWLRWTWRQRFRHRYAEALKRTRLCRQAELLKRQWQVTLHRQECHRLRRALQVEQAELARLQEAAAAAQHAARVAAARRQIGSGATYWVPAAVARGLDAVVTQEPLDVSSPGRAPLPPPPLRPAPRCAASCLTLWHASWQGPLTLTRPWCNLTPQAKGREQDLRQRSAVSALEVRKLLAALAAGERRLEAAQRRLAALHP